VSKKHPLRIHVEHNEFRFDAVITNQTEARNQIGPLVTYIVERVQEEILQAQAAAPDPAQEAAALAAMNQAVASAPPSIEAIIEQVADRVIEKLAALGEQDLERISCRLAGAAGTKMKGTP
jgi:hypothetical protein